MTIIAIDPGAAGGIAWQADGLKACCVAMPKTEGDLVVLIRNLVSVPAGECVFYLEDLVKHMGGGIPASAMATYASNWGFLKGCIQYSGKPLRLVNPRSWASKIGLGKSGGMPKPDWKRKLKAEAQRLYPHLEVTLKTADALLILEYARRAQLPHFPASPATDYPVLISP